MVPLKKEQMLEVIGGEWVWKPNLGSIPISGGNTCMDIWNYYGGNASYAASHLFATGGDYIVYTCMNWTGGGGD